MAAVVFSVDGVVFACMFRICSHTPACPQIEGAAAFHESTELKSSSQDGIGDKARRHMRYAKYIERQQLDQGMHALVAESGREQIRIANLRGRGC